MSRLIDISDERFWQILFDEACVEGQQAERIEKELEKIVFYNVEEVVEKLEKAKMQAFLTLANTGIAKFDFDYDNVLANLNKTIEIVRSGLNTERSNA